MIFDESRRSCHPHAVVTPEQGKLWTAELLEEALNLLGAGQSRRAGPTVLVGFMCNNMYCILQSPIQVSIAGLMCVCAPYVWGPRAS